MCHHVQKPSTANLAQPTASKCDFCGLASDDSLRTFCFCGSAHGKMVGRGITLLRCCLHVVFASHCFHNNFSYDKHQSLLFDHGPSKVHDHFQEEKYRVDVASDLGLRHFVCLPASRRMGGLHLPARKRYVFHVLRFKLILRGGFHPFSYRSSRGDYHCLFCESTADQQSKQTYQVFITRNIDRIGRDRLREDTLLRRRHSITLLVSRMSTVSSRDFRS